MTNEVDPFDGREPVPGLESLGRAIVDEFGQPSGSPANYEATRGVGAEPPSISDEEKARIIADVATEFARG